MSEAPYWEQRLRDSYSLASVGYIGLGEGFNGWMYRVRRQLFVRRLAPLVSRRPSLDVLDVGSGTGFYVDAWRTLGASSVTGLDITAKAVAELRTRYPDSRFDRVDIAMPDPPLPEEGFDAVSAFDVLFHITDDNGYRRAIENVHGALRPDGLFVFSDNLLHGQTVRGNHQVSRALDDTMAVLDAAGFEIVMRRPVFVLMSKPVDSSSRAHALWWDALRKAIQTRDLVGAAVGALLYPLELALATRTVEGPSTEMVICRKRA